MYMKKKNERGCTHLLAFRDARSSHRWVAVFPLATILASVHRPRLIDLESRAQRCTPTLQRKLHVTTRHLFKQEAGRRKKRTECVGEEGESEIYLVLRGFLSQRFCQSHRQSCGMMLGKKLYAPDRCDQARRGGIARIRRNRGSACPSRQRHRRRRHQKAVAGLR